MNVIFLDIDGVLNSAEYDSNRNEKDGNIDLTRLPLLKEIVDKTNAKIVLSSSWRKVWFKDISLCDIVGKELSDTFNSAGLEIYDKTPVLGRRKDEIKAWLQNNPHIENYAIIDDMTFGWEELSDHLVKTNALIGRGLEQTHVDSAIKILTYKDGKSKL